MMNPLVIKYTDCDICGAKAGHDCIELDNSGVESHGMRLDSFCQSAPYEARLQLHYETTEYMKEVCPHLSAREVDICLSEKELDALYGKVPKKVTKNDEYQNLKERLQVKQDAK